MLSYQHFAGTQLIRLASAGWRTLSVPSSTIFSYLQSKGQDSLAREANEARSQTPGLSQSEAAGRSGPRRRCIVCICTGTAQRTKRIRR